MKVTPEHNQRMARLGFAKVYPLYLDKITNKGRTKKELNQVITWLTGFDATKIKELLKREVTFEEFFSQADINPAVVYITGVVCGYRIEEINNDTTRQVRYLDKLVDELAKGRPMEKILRTVEE